MIAAVKVRMGPVSARIAPMKNHVAPWGARAVRLEKQLEKRVWRLEKRVKKRVNRFKARGKRRIARMKWVAWLNARMPWIGRLNRAARSVPGLQAPVVLIAATAALAAWPSFGPIVGALSLWQLGKILRVGRKRPPGSAMSITALIAALACGLSLQARGAATVWLALLVGVAVVVSLAQGALHGRVVQRIRAFNLPGVPNDQRAQEPGALTSVVPTAGVLLALLLIAESIWDLPSYIGAIALLVTLGWLGRCGLRLRAMVHARRGGRADLEVRAALERYAPQFYVYFSGPVAGDYQLKMWLPYLEQLGVPFAILARSSQMLPRAARLKTTAPLISCPVVTGLDVCMVPSVRAVFYVNINGSIADGVRYIDRTHVHLNHGDSDKPASYHPIFAMFDRNFVAGPAAIDRFGRHGVFMPKEKCVIVGRPQVAEVVEQNVDPAPGRRTVLYAPTWQSGMREMSLSSLEHGERIVRALIDDGARVIFRPHPLSAGQRQAAQTIARINAMLVAARTPECAHLTSSQALKESIIGNFNRSDALVTDVSSVASDYLASCKPMAVVLPTNTQALADADEYPVLRATYLIDLGDDDLAARLAPLMGGDADPLEAVRHELRSYYLGDERDSVRLFLDSAKAVLAGGSEPVAAAG
ncbi:CDP-glycerol glycerophosphotransferase family protein [Flexivirga alba]|uniref:CDP-glycerol glycerophosphotransferase family protein n=1 Tax=Flexivirga alba TaxID=702742 RepID=A0ABW2AG76_9MICO